MVNYKYKVGNFHHNIVEENNGKSDIQGLVYLPSVYQEQKDPINDKGSNINVGSISCKILLL